MKLKRNSASFKEEAAKLVKEREGNITQAAKELGISASGLRHWAEVAEDENGQRERPSPSENEEIRELNREVKILRIEREILKRQ
jgi:transposase